MQLQICTGCHAREGERKFAAWLNQLETRFGIGYFGGEGGGLEVEFVTCLSHCEQGFSVAVEGYVLVLDKAEDFEHLLGRMQRLLEV
jgi:predicted metal-binding protein